MIRSNRLLLSTLFALSALAMSACDMIPSYRVYNARKTGEAEDEYFGWLAKKKLD